MKTLFWIGLIASSCNLPPDTASPSKEFAAIRGVNFVGPRNFVDSSALLPIVDLQANYLAIVPYAFSPNNQPVVNFDTSRQWWGERKEGVTLTIKYAHDLGMEVMLKPHIWVFGQGWPGDFKLNSEDEWQQWEEQYQNYILTFAELAESRKVRIFCLGTEIRVSARERPRFWQNLIKEVKKVYSGKLTYAANWDNYENIYFWSELDFIGIDAYFPLIKGAAPNYPELKKAWEQQAASLQRFAQRWEKPILFTEFGYQSMDYSTESHWEHNPDSLTVNLALQDQAYRALFETVWHQPWFSGGFLWKWYADHRNAGGGDHKSWTPQNKPAQNTIKRYYSK